MKFEWDPAKDDKNVHKHGVAFDEASTVFGDILSMTGRDLEHSAGEDRYVTFGLSSRGECSRPIILTALVLSVFTVPVRPSERRNEFMKKAKLEDEEMRAEYRREDLGLLVRGKYANAYVKATNVVVIDPGLTKVFPNSEAVNEALRNFLAVATLTTGITGRSRPITRKRVAA